MRTALTLLIVIVFILLSFPCEAGGFRIGASKRDITGPAAEVGMMGYGDLWQTTQGIHSRLFARAFVISAGNPEKRIAFVSADLCFIAQAVKIAVVDRLERALPGVFTDANVMLTATHTHSGPGGFSHSTLYNITILGFDARNFEAIVSGITDAILDANTRAKVATLDFNEGPLFGATVNRSVSTEVNSLMTQLSAKTARGQRIGIINWFAIHGTSMSKDDRLISSDNKGHAAWLFENYYGRDAIAAFANSDEGDVSPNIYGANWERLYPDEKSVEVSGVPQFKKAVELEEEEGARLAPTIDYRHLWIRMPGYPVQAKFTGTQERRLCLGALGYSFAAGAKDGPSGVPGFREGMTQGEVGNATDPLLWLYNLLGITVFSARPEDDLCQAPKPVLVSTGRQDPPWAPDVLPFQLFRIGNLAIAAVPAELTTQSGRAVRAEIQAELRPVGVEHVVIAGLANTYSGYVATPVEYGHQGYEGASTLFGPDTLPAYVQIFSAIAHSLATGEPLPPSEPRPILTTPKFNLAPGVFFDDKRVWEEYGAPLEEPDLSYSHGDTVKIPFRTGHPKNDLRLNSSYFEIQVWLDREYKWLPIATENDPNVTYRWRRSHEPDCLGCSTAEFTWKIPQDLPTGEYRVVHRGARKEEKTGRIKKFVGQCETFWVED